MPSIKEPKNKLIYVVSSRYSGTTLLSAILGAHPDISTIGERKKFYIKSLRPSGTGRLDCSCGKLYSECEYWSEIRDEIIRQVPGKDLNTDVTQFVFYQNKLINRLSRKVTQNLIATNRSIRYTPFAGRVEKICQINELLINKSLEMDGNTVFVDSSKPIEHALYLSLIENFDFYVIYMVRDPRAQSASAIKYNKWSIEQAAQTWLAEHQKIRKILNSWKVKKFELTYGSFCREPEKYLKAMLDFAGVDSSRSSLDFSSTPRHFSGNKPMLKSKTSEIRERKDWIERLSPEDVRKIEDIAMDFWTSEVHTIKNMASNRNV